MSKKNRSQFLNLLINIVIPVIILTRFSGGQYLGQTWGLVTALAFPIVYGLYELYSEKKYNVFSVIGIVSIFLTGGIGLLELSNKWLAIKEAGVPFVLGVAVLISQKTKYPLMKVLLDPVIDHAKIERALQENGTVSQYEKRFKISTFIIAISFFFSSLLNYILAKVVVVSPPGTIEYNAELGRMTALSYPVIAIPSMILFVAAAMYLVLGLEKMTKLNLNDLIKQ